MSIIRKAGCFLARADIFFYTLIWLMVLLVCGTIAQRDVGIFQAQQIYFSSLILWLGPLPLPGGFPTMSLITAGLLAKLIFKSPWNFRQTGIIITHMGALLLLLGGFLTALYSSEGSMVIYEGQTSDYYSSYNKRELVVFNEKTGKSTLAVPWEKIHPGVVFEVPDPGFLIKIVKACRNCKVFPRKTAPDDPVYRDLRGRTRDFDMEAIPLDKVDERNQSGVLFRISGVSESRDGLHMSFDFIDKTPWVEIKGIKYHIAVRRTRDYLPFKIKLFDFEKQFHAGTGIPRSYKSEISLIDGDSRWRSIVQMNEPLRYKGYTFYQSSYIDGEVSATIFAVVNNVGRMFPYISSIVMCTGLLIHLFINLPGLIKKHV